MEAEIAGKFANGFAEVVQWEPGMRVMKVKWLLDVYLNTDGSIKRIKTRLVGCGYSQVEATVDAFLDKKQFSILPSKPPSPYKASGQEVILVSFGRGVVKSTPGFEDIKQMPSFVYLETGVRPGIKVDYTIDLFTGIGSVILMHKDPAVLEEDIRRIRDMEKNNELFTFEKQAGYMKSPSLIGLDLLDVEDSAASRDL